MKPASSSPSSLLPKNPSTPIPVKWEKAGSAESSIAKEKGSAAFIALDAPAAPYVERAQALQDMLAGGVTNGVLQQPVVRRLAGHIAESLGQFALGAVATSLLQRSSSQPTGSEFARGQLLSSAVTALWTQLIAAYKNPSSDLPERLQRVHSLLMATDQETVRKLPDSLQQRLRQLDFEIAGSIQSQQFEQAEVMMGRRQGILLSFPQSVLPLYRLPGVATLEQDELRFRKIDTNIAHLLQDYRHIPELAEIVRGIRLHSLMSQPAARVQVFLYGAGGVGKTHFVRRLRDALGLPLFETSLQGEKARELLGLRIGLSGGSAGYMLSDKSHTDSAVLTMIPFALTSTGFKNSLLFCDEASEAMNTKPDPRYASYGGSSVGADGLKQFFSPDNVEISSSALIPDLKYDFRHATVILAGNEAPEDAALAQRFQIVHFPDLPRSQKQKAAEQTMLATIKAIPGLTAEMQAEIEGPARGYIAKVLDLNEHHKVEGARFVQRAMSQVVETLFMGLCEKTPVSATDLMAGVERMYRKEPAAEALPAAIKQSGLSGLQGLSSW